MGLRDIEASLPPGFRFHPSDEELVCHYLSKKVANQQTLKGTLVEIDLHTCEPWQLPDMAKLCPNEWYFFSFRDRKYATGFRTNRATISGYWKATGKDRTIHDPRTRAIVGMRKTLVFYRNRAPSGIKTGWIMHEFRLENPNMPPKEDWVLCRVSYKGRVGNNNNNNNDNDDVSPKHMHDSTIDVATTPFANQSIFPSTDLMNSFELNPSLFELAHHLQGQNNNTFVSEAINLKYDDDNGYFSRMSFGENGSGEYDRVDPNLVEMQFEFEDDRGDGSLIYI